MAALTVQDVTVAGFDDIVFDPADTAGDTIDTNGGRPIALLVKNDDTASHTATMDTPGTVRGLTIENPSATVPAGSIGVFPLVRKVFGGTASVTYDAVTSVTVAAVRLEQ